MLDKRPVRHRVIFLSLILSLTLLLFRLAIIGLVCSGKLSMLAKRQYVISLDLKPKRGTVYDRNMEPLAMSLNVKSVYAVPRQMRDKYGVASQLRRILNLNEAFLIKRLSKDKAFVWLARKIDLAKAQKVEQLNSECVRTILEPKRFYPSGELASHILGYVGMDDKGLEGIELLYDRYLFGKKGRKISRIDGKGRVVSDELTIQPIDGYDLVLTLDQTIQNIAESAIDKAYKKWKAKSATIIVTDPNSGSVLALANRPAFDPNHIKRTDSGLLRNRAICDIYEPGSVFKVVTASGALEEGVARITDRFYCENGSFRVPGGHILNDHTPHGWLTFEEVIKQSSNIGTAKVATRLGKAKLYEYIKKFGFGKPSGIDLPGEVKGILHPLGRWSKLSPYVLPMGQEIGVTSMQIAAAVGAIANGGILYEPRIVQCIKGADGKVIRSFEPVARQRVISPETSLALRKILAGVVEEGTGKLAAVKGYGVAGKTGTAQKLETDGSYSHSKFVASFVGFAPADEPLICIVVVLDEPRPYYYGGVVAAPVFSEVADQTLKYLGAVSDEQIITAKRHQ